jgi:hypothetical protein
MIVIAKAVVLLAAMRGWAVIPANGVLLNGHVAVPPFLLNCKGGAQASACPCSTLQHAQRQADY